MESSEFFATVRTMHEEARRRGLFFQRVDSEHLEGRRILLHGRERLAFASCSYLGLERHPALVAGVHDYVDRYGTQFSASRGYVALQAHVELEAALGELFDGYPLLATSTTLAHQIALPVLATEKDAIVLDHQIHHSVHMAATLARAAGTHVEIVRHGQLDQAEELVARLARTKRTVWFCCDGVFSMFGDLAPIGLLRRLLDVAPNVHLYVDDAHGMSWAGRHGRGSFLSRMPLHERLVLATSLNKAFSAAGGCVVFASEELRERVRVCAGPVVFSGPLQPPMLGAALASAAVHRSPEIEARQAALRARVDRCNELARALDLPLLAVNESPIFFFRCGLPRVAYAVAEALLARDLYVTVSMYPAVPMQTAGIRLSLTTEHSLAEVDRVCEALAVAIPQAMASENLSREELDRVFAGAIPQESLRGDAYRGRTGSGRFLALSYAEPADAAPREPPRALEADPARLDVQLVRTIAEIDRATWDALLGSRSCSSWAAMRAMEAIFRGHEAPEHNWSHLYVIVRDDAGEVLAATYFTVMLSKDDMLMRTEVSSAIEAHRRADPYFLTSRVVCMGSGFSEGAHLYLKRDGAWRAALTRVLEIALDEYEAQDAGILMLRDFRDDDVELGEFMLDSGFIKVPMLDSHLLEVTWEDDAGMLARLSRRRRRQLREVQEMTPHYRRRVVAADALGPAEEEHLYRLYRNVADRKLRLNMFPLPRNIVRGIVASPAWEVVTLHLAPDAGGPADGAAVAWYGAHVHGGHYMPLLCGLDYEHVYAHGAYRQLLYQIVLRAQELQARQIHLGMDANYEKERFRTTRVPTCAYVHTRDDFVGARMREVVAEVGLAADLEGRGST
jgi:7-keto-8-aminopelargonate synthetase-like enzyme/predicted N-acyltransferase